MTRDGWRSRVWSIAERRWLEGGAWLGSSGFDSLTLRIPTRGFAPRVRWRAAVRHSTDGWRSASDASGLVEPRPPLPQRSTLWPIRQPSGTPRQRQAALDAAGVGGQRPGQPVVALDPGHGGEQTGPSFNGVVESHSNLALAREIAARLEAAGVYVVLARDGDTLARLNFSGAPGRADLHARVELAHLADADLFVSLHSNAAHNDWQRGLEAWYFPSPDGSGANRALAQWMLDAIAASLAQWGYDAPTITYDSSCWEILEGHCDPLYVIAPFLLLDRQAALDWGLNPRGDGAERRSMGGAAAAALSDRLDVHPRRGADRPCRSSAPGRPGRGPGRPRLGGARHDDAGRAARTALHDPSLRRGSAAQRGRTRRDRGGRRPGHPQLAAARRALALAIAA